MFFAYYSGGVAKYLDSKGETKEYKLNIQNPLMVDGDMESSAALKAYKKLTGKCFKKELTEKNWIELDKDLATALKKSNHDSILYSVDGKPLEMFIDQSNVNITGGNYGERRK